MKLNEYQAAALATSAADREEGKLGRNKRLAVACLGLAGEAGEVCDLFKKHIGHGHDLDESKIIEEIGDVLWYIAEIASALGHTMGDVAFWNLAKLRRRYPNGFTAERSINREEVQHHE